MTGGYSPLGPMKWLAELLSGPVPSPEGIAKLGRANFVELEKYYEIWRKQIEATANDGGILSNGWAFSTLSGIASYESHIRATEFRSIYFNKTAEIAAAVAAIEKDLLDRSRSIGGLMIYGYGNVFREAHFVERARQRKLISSQSMYLIDCSIFYHVFATSSLNPLREHTGPSKIRAELFNYLDSIEAPKVLKEWRSDLNVMKSTVHLFLGNTFCNAESDVLLTALNAATVPGDYVVAEYANYLPGHFQAPTADYVSEMARLAAREVFSRQLNTVTAVNIMLNDTAMATTITISGLAANPSLTFRSMLRRKFDPTEVTNGPYELVSRQLPLDGKLFLDTYRRTA